MGAFYHFQEALINNPLDMKANFNVASMALGHGDIKLAEEKIKVAEDNIYDFEPEDMEMAHKEIDSMKQLIQEVKTTGRIDMPRWKVME